MESRSKKDIEEYVLINHEYETCEELAKNCGVEQYIIRTLLKKKGITCLSPMQEREDFAKANYLKYEFDEMVKILDISPTNRMLLDLYATKKKMPQSNGLPVSRYKMLLEHAIVDEQAKEMDIRYSEKGKVKHVPGVYDQSSSPYGIADELREIKIKR